MWNRRRTCDSGEQAGPALCGVLFACDPDRDPPPDKAGSAAPPLSKSGPCCEPKLSCCRESTPCGSPSGPSLEARCDSWGPRAGEGRKPEAPAGVNTACSGTVDWRCCLWAEYAALAECAPRPTVRHACTSGVSAATELRAAKPGTGVSGIPPGGITPKPCFRSPVRYGSGVAEKCPCAAGSGLSSWTAAVTTAVRCCFSGVAWTGSTSCERQCKIFRSSWPVVLGNKLSEHWQMIAHLVAKRRNTAARRTPRALLLQGWRFNCGVRPSFG